MLQNNIKNISFSVPNPRKNLPANVRNKRTETLFQNKFLKQWTLQNNAFGIGGSQFAVPGFGIADYVFIETNQHITAFEFKISDWRKGLAQAARYKCYAHRSFLVVPQSIIHRIKPFFKGLSEINIGLYAFDCQTEIIKIIFQPKIKEPFSKNAHNNALSILNRKRNFRKLCKSINS
jgi:hypothetical protein